MRRLVVGLIVLSFAAPVGCKTVTEGRETKALEGGAPAPSPSPSASGAGATVTAAPSASPSVTATPETSGWGTPPAPSDRALEVGEGRIVGYEYWPFRFNAATGKCPYPYPTGVKRGFGAGSPAAQACMRQAHDALWKILKASPESFTAWRNRGGPSTFNLIVNDYAAAQADAKGEPIAACQPEASMRAPWQYNPPSGPIEWVAELMKDGRCRVPTAADLERLAANG